MPHSLRPANQLAASLVAAILFVHAGGSLALAEPVPTVAPPESTVRNLSLAPDEIHLAHGGDGCEASAGSAITGASAAPLVGGVSTHADHNSYMDSLWGNLLLQMAYQRDPEIARLVKRAKVVNGLTMLSIMGVTGLGLAQSIHAHNSANTKVSESHHPGDHDHVHMSPESRVPSTLGIISSGLTIASLGVRSIANKHVSHQVAKRQKAIQANIFSILDRLEQSGPDTPDTNVRQELSTLIGPRASSEFLALWLATHPERTAKSAE